MNDLMFRGAEHKELDAMGKSWRLKKTEIWAPRSVGSFPGVPLLVSELGDQGCRPTRVNSTMSEFPVASAPTSASARALA